MVGHQGIGHAQAARVDDARKAHEDTPFHLDQLGTKRGQPQFVHQRVVIARLRVGVVIFCGHGVKD